MAREFSKAFYKSTEWKKARDYIFKRDNGLCQDCLKKSKLVPGKEVHHIEFLTPLNITDPDVTLNESNLILLCKECHHNRHNNKRSVREGLRFNEYGELIEDMEEN